jgi:hypothetical protein
LDGRALSPRPISHNTAARRASNRREPRSKGYATSVEGETTYTIDEAAAILEESPERVREMLITGELDGIPPGATVSGEWKVLLPSTLGEDKSQHEPPVEESPDSVSEGQKEAPDVATQEHGGAVRVLAERLENAAARAAEYRVMLEFTAQAESTLRAELEEERRKREAAERERDELRRRLESRPEPREAPVNPTPESPTGTGGGPQTPSERPWWRYWG